RSVLALAVLLAALTVCTPAASAHTRRCGSVHLGPTTFSVTIEKGPRVARRPGTCCACSSAAVACITTAAARRTRGWASGAGAAATGPAAARTYVHARDYIVAQMR